MDPAWAEKTPRNLLLLSRENEFYTLVDEEMIKLSILAYTKEYEKCELKIETFLWSHSSVNALLPGQIFLRNVPWYNGILKIPESRFYYLLWVFMIPEKRRVLRPFIKSLDLSSQANNCWIDVNNGFMASHVSLPSWRLRRLRGYCFWRFHDGSMLLSCSMGLFSSVTSSSSPASRLRCCASSRTTWPTKNNQFSSDISYKW